MKLSKDEFNVRKSQLTYTTTIKTAAFARKGGGADVEVSVNDGVICARDCADGLEVYWDVSNDEKVSRALEDFDAPRTIGMLNGFADVGLQQLDGRRAALAKETEQ